MQKALVRVPRPVSSAVCVKGPASLCSGHARGRDESMSVPLRWSPSTLHRGCTMRAHAHLDVLVCVLRGHISAQAAVRPEVSPTLLESRLVGDRVASERTAPFTASSHTATAVAGLNRSYNSLISVTGFDAGRTVNRARTPSSTKTPTQTNATPHISGRNLVAGCGQRCLPASALGYADCIHWEALEGFEQGVCFGLERRRRLGW